MFDQRLKRGECPLLGAKLAFDFGSSCVVNCISMAPEIMFPRKDSLVWLPGGWVDAVASVFGDWSPIVIVIISAWPGLDFVRVTHVNFHRYQGSEFRCALFQGAGINFHLGSDYGRL